MRLIVRDSPKRTQTRLVAVMQGALFDGGGRVPVTSCISFGVILMKALCGSAEAAGIGSCS